MAYKWVVKYNKEKFKFDLNEPPSMEEFKARLFSLTDVTPDRQKLMIRGKILNTDEDLTKQKQKAKFFLYGTNEVMAAAPKEKIIFVEDMTEAERAQNKITLPCGLENLGNTCYLNSTVQAIRACTDFKQDMKKWVAESPEEHSALLGMAPDGLARAFGTSLAEMDTVEDAFVPHRFVGILRREFPKFAETSPKTGGYIQHDADEFLVELLNKINQHVTCVDENGKAGKIVDRYFTGEYLTTLTCDESKEESTSKNETFLKLQCFVDSQTNFLGDGIKKRLSEKIEKNSKQLGRNAIWSQERRIAKLPPLLIVQIMRFFWKQNINKSAKIRRKVAFPLRLDLQDFCAPKLRDKIVEYRSLKEKEVERRLAVKDQKLQAEVDAAEEAAKKKSMAMDIDEKDEVKEKKKEAAKNTVSTDNVDVEVVEQGFGVRIKRGAGPVFIIRKGSKVRVKNESSDWTVSKIHVDGPTVDLVKGERKKNTIPEYLSPISNEEIKLSKPTGYYRIVGLVTHKGLSANSGHYIGYAREPAVPASGARPKQPARWLKFDDDYTSIVDDAHIQQLFGGTGDMQMGYICIYKECEVWEEDEVRG